jgi:osmotically-inducible protein OsmY
MSKYLAFSLVTGTTLLMGALSGCAAYRGCGDVDCQGDRKITSDVEHLLDRYPALVGSIPITVQTDNGVVYLNGLVETDLERYLAENVAGRAPNVAMIVNGIAVQER